MRRLRERSRFRDDDLVVATETVFASANALANGFRPRIAKGEAVRASDYRVRSDPDVWELAPDIRCGGEPAPDETVAIARVTFIDDQTGAMIWPGRRFHTYDRLVQENPGFFFREAPGTP